MRWRAGVAGVWGERTTRRLVSRRQAAADFESDRRGDVPPDSVWLRSNSDVAQPAFWKHGWKHSATASPQPKLVRSCGMHSTTGRNLFPDRSAQTSTVSLRRDQRLRSGANLATRPRRHHAALLFESSSSQNAMATPMHALRSARPISAAAVCSAYVEELLNAIPKGRKGVVQVGAGNLVLSRYVWGVAQPVPLGMHSMSFRYRAGDLTEFRTDRWHGQCPTLFPTLALASSSADSAVRSILGALQVRGKVRIRW